MNRDETTVRPRCDDGANQADVSTLTALRSGRRLGRLGLVVMGVWLALGCSLAAAASPAATQHLIEVGDVLDFSVASLPALQRRSSVDINGEVNFPLLQDIKAAGLPLPELRTKVRELISAKPFRQRSAEGHETLLTIDPDEITISIVEYRPIYVTGDVARPGEQQFRPGITVRQAVALGGGVGTTHARQSEVELQAADLQSEYKSLWADLVQSQAAMARLDAELADEPQSPGKPLPPGPLGPQVQQAIVTREQGQLESQVADYHKEKIFLSKSIEQAKAFLATLSEQQSNEKQGADLDAQDFARVNELFSKGAVPITRVTDARRAMLLSSTRQLQTSVQVAETEIRREALIRSADKLDDQRRADLLKQLQDASLKSIDTQAKLRAASQKLDLLGDRSRQSEAADPVDVQIFRKGEAPLVATDDVELLPGDVVQATIRRDPTGDLVSQR